MNALKPSAVCFHAWVWSDGPDSDQEYCDQPGDADGWCVYTRHDGEEGHPFDLSEEMDFPTREEAEREATSRAARLGVEAQEY